MRSLNQASFDLHRQNYRTSLYILGVHEVIGLEEIVDGSLKRRTSAICTSTDGECYFISAENFIDCINLFGISENILSEQVIKH